MGQVPNANGVYRAGGGVLPPRIVFKTAAPEYTDEARKARVNATVVLDAVIGEDGKVLHVTPLRPAGFGLDESAMRSLQGWRFEPGTKNGVPVKVQAQIEVNFRLLLNQGQLDRLVFSGAGPRPELMHGSMPSNPGPGNGQAVLRIAFTAPANGKPTDVNVVEATDDGWAREGCP